MTNAAQSVDALGGANLGAIFMDLCRKNTTSTVTDTVSSYSAADIMSQTCAVMASIEDRFDAKAPQAGSPLVLIIPKNLVTDVSLFFGLSAAGYTPCLGDAGWSKATILSVCDAYGIDLLASDRPLVADSFSEAGTDFSIAKGLKLFARTAKSLSDTRRVAGVSFVRFSSGSTGRPKALAFGALAAVRAAETWVKASHLCAEDRILCLASLNNGLAFNTSLLSTFISGCDLVLHSGKFNPNLIWRKIQEHEPTVLVGFPLLWELLLGSGQKNRDALCHARFCWSSAASLEPQLAEDWYRSFGVPIHHYYGVAEAGPVTFNRAGEAPGLGPALPGCALSIQDHGENGVGRISVHTPYMAEGYLSENAGTLLPLPKQSRYFMSSDLGSLDPNGVLHLSGRADRVINIRGQKFDLTHAEHAISEKLGVAASHLVQDASGTLGLFLETDLPITLDDFRVRCADILEAWQFPGRLACVEQFPRSAAGKILVGQLTEIKEQI